MPPSLEARTSLPDPDSQGLPSLSSLSTVTKITFFGILLLTLVTTVLWSHYRLFWADELLEYYTDTKTSASQVLLGQLRAPFSLEPPAFHLFLHWTHALVPRSKLGARVPSILALLLTECCTFLITWRASGRQITAVVAMLLPYVWVTVDYAPEARAYSLLTACLAFALLCWQRAASGKQDRSLTLLGLAASLACAILCHYYGIFLALPLWMAEMVRTVQRRKLDRGILWALFVGTAVLLLDVPFQRALAPFREHYYSTGETQWSNIGFTYYWFQEHFQIYLDAPDQVSYRGMECLVVVGILIACAIRRIVRQWRASPSSAGLETALCIAALLPVTNLVVAQYTRAYSPRYSLPAVVGLSVLTALALDDLWLTFAGQGLLAVVLTYAGTAYAIDEIRMVHIVRDQGQRAIGFTPAQRAALAAGADHHVYVQDLAKFLFLRYYAPPEIAQELTGFYSNACELRWSGRNPSSLFAQNIKNTTSLPFAPFGELLQQGGPHFLVLFNDPNEEWIGQELKAEHATVEVMGPALGGDLVRVTFAKLPACGR